MTKKVRVLVVDDSAFARATVARVLNAAPDLEVVGFACDGADALLKVNELEPDVITLDVTMPGMDGLETLERLMSDRPTPVVMLSALTAENASVTIEALRLGAVDFFLKGPLANPAGHQGAAEGLAQKVRMAAHVPPGALGARRGAEHLARVRKPRGHGRPRALQKVVVIGSSTGGPQALFQVLPKLPGSLPAAILVVQHMPPKFTDSLAQRLDRASAMSVKEARAGDEIKPGVVLIAPGGQHMTVSADGTVGLDNRPLVCGVRPSIDVTMESVVAIYGSASVEVVLTGMGVDGCRGAGMTKAAGGLVVAQDERTSTVYGMPKVVADAGYADKVLPLSEMAAEIVRVCTERRANGAQNDEVDLDR